MSNRKEPTLSSDSPSPSALGGGKPRSPTDHRDRIAREARSTGSRNSGRNGNGARSRKSGVTLAVLACLVAVASAGFAAYLSVQTDVLNNRLVMSEQKVSVLEQKLTLSDDEGSQSVSALQASLKEAHSEIRKLWGVSKIKSC